MFAEAAIVVLVGSLAGALWQWRKQSRRAGAGGRELAVLQSRHDTLTATHDALVREHESYGEEEHRMFDFLHELGESLYADTSARKLHRRIVRGAADVVAARGGALYIHDPSRGQLVPAALTRDCPPLIELPVPVAGMIGHDPAAVRSYVRLQSIADTAGVLGDVFGTGRVIQLADLHRHPAFEHLPPVEGRTLAVMIAPLFYGPKRLGVLAVARPSGATSFSAHDFDVFKSLAEQSAFALGNAMIHQEAMDKRRIEDELHRASEIQRVLLPSKPPELSGFTLAAAYQPAKVVSGDYYDFIPLDATHVGVVIADVSGKGIPASLVMATCRGLLRVSAEQTLSPAIVLQQVNRLLFGDIREDMFVSLAYCVLDTSTGDVTLARAGHDPPLLYHRGEDSVELLKPPGLALGVDRGAVFNRSTRETTFRMEPGDRLLLYTDGVTEALDAARRDEFGMDRLREVFVSEARAGTAPDALLSSIKGHLARFATGARQHDDITLVAIERR